MVIVLVANGVTPVQCMLHGTAGTRQGSWDRDLLHRLEPVHEGCDLADVPVGQKAPPSRHAGISYAVLDDPEELALVPFTAVPGELRRRWVEGRAEAPRGFPR